MPDTLLIAPQWIGDAVMAQPLVALLAARGERVSAVGLPALAPVLRAMPGMHEVIEAPLRHGHLDWGLRRAIARDMRARSFARAYVLGNNLKSRLIPWMAGIPERVGYRGEAAGLLLTRQLGRAVAADSSATQRADMRLHYAALALAPEVDVAQPELAVDTAAQDAARRACGVAPGAIALCPGAEYGPAKQWPIEHFAQLARLARAQGRPVIVLGTARDAPAGAAIAAAAPGALDLCGNTSLTQAIALLAGAAGVLSNDSGLMHVGAALGRPTLGLYGSTDPRHTPPAARRSATLWLHLECSPCFARECRYGHLACLRGIAPAQAWDHLLRLMD
jgi:heptosyltransferase-2